jgi:hypothetical protein
LALYIDCAIIYSNFNVGWVTLSLTQRNIALCWVQYFKPTYQEPFDCIEKAIALITRRGHKDIAILPADELTTILE